jgi:aerobic-type carbon monoxide dehydrogenase small subunit (CoxS/CutS family)
VKAFGSELMEKTISFTLNGSARKITTDPKRSLLEVLREDLQLTGTKYGCGEGQCRACTVLIDGESASSCLTDIGDVDKRQVLTIEGLAENGHLHPIQQAVMDEGAFQCGYCTAGMIMGLAGALKKNPKASESEVMSEMQHHLCRCCSYVKYKGAIRRVLGLGGKAVGS